MLKITSLQIPEILPHADAIRSFGDNKHSYEPKFWEFQYEIYRYLKQASEEYLLSRYRSIIRNMYALVSTDRHVIPIQSFLSSWYWYRKEHQTRLEFFLRKMDLPVSPPKGILNNDRKGAPTHPRSPNAGDILFRYGKIKYMKLMVQHGSIRIGPASFYRNIESTARADEECKKISFIPGAYTRIITNEEREVPIRGDVQRTVSAPNYYMLSMSCDWDLSMFDDFSADACVVLRDPERFAERLEFMSKPQLDGWYFHHNPIQYFDPYEMQRNQCFDAAMCKDFCFAYQREYRFLWIHTGGKEAKGFKILELGPLENITELHIRPQTTNPTIAASVSIPDDAVRLNVGMKNEKG